jgi:hypothetical protein
MAASRACCGKMIVRRANLHYLLAWSVLSVYLLRLVAWLAPKLPVNTEMYCAGNFVSVPSQMKERSDQLAVALFAFLVPLLQLLLCDASNVKGTNVKIII